MARKTGFHADERGFTMIVVAIIAIAVGALAVVGGMNIQTVMRQDAQTGTRTNLDSIVQALAAYAAVNNRLPCPAEGTATSGRGMEDCNALDSQTGIVPWRALGIREDVALDRWGRYVAYRVFPALTGNGALVGADTANGLTVCRDFNPCANTETTSAAFVLISHGQSGLGGFPRGQTAPLGDPPSGGAEEANLASPNGAIYYNLPFTLQDANGEPLDPANDAAHFDDILAFRTVAGLLQDSGLAEPTTTIPPPPPDVNPGFDGGGEYSAQHGDLAQYQSGKGKGVLKQGKKEGGPFLVDDGKGGTVAIDSDSNLFYNPDNNGVGTNQGNGINEGNSVSWTFALDMSKYYVQFSVDFIGSKRASIEGFDSDDNSVGKHTLCASAGAGCDAHGDNAFNGSFGAHFRKLVITAESGNFWVTMVDADP